MIRKCVYGFAALLLFKLSAAEVSDKNSIITKEAISKSDSDLKASESGRLFDFGSRYTPATVYGAPGGGYSPTGWSTYNTGLGYGGALDSGYNGYNGYNGYVGNGYNSLGSGYSSFGTGGYAGNGGYGGYAGNGGLLSYSGYNNPYYSGQNNLGYGYYNRGIGYNGYNGYNNYRNRYSSTGYAGITPSYVSGYRGYSK